MNNRSRLLKYLSTLVFAVLFLLPAGCHSKVSPSAVSAEAPIVAKPLTAAVLTPSDIKKYHPNEAGVVPILEYHDIVTTMHVHGYQYPAVSFQKDIEYLYSHGYRPISLSDYVHGWIDCPAGTTPVILTFDDALRGQFNYLPDGSIDPNCAVGILEAFHAQHPDWALKGTFFILTNMGTHLPPSFYQKGLEVKKLQYLVSQGFEIGNHTVHHRMGMNTWQDDRVESEFAGAAANIHKLLPGYNVDTLALPYGVYPKNRRLVVSGSSGGVDYSNICAMMAGANPAPSPIAKKFSPYRLPRIIPGNEDFALRFWFSYLEKHKGVRYVSDGDPTTYTVAASDKSQIDVQRIKAMHFNYRIYSGSKIKNVISGQSVAPPA